MTREQRLVDLARAVRRYFRDPACRGTYDDILLGRRLSAILEEYADEDAFAPTHDGDRAEWRARRDDQLAQVLDRR